MLERDSANAQPSREALPDRPAPKRVRIGVSAGACVAAVSVLAACGSSGGTSSSSGSGQVKGTVIVFAAASLTNAFDKIGAQFEKAHPGVSVKFNYAGSSSLATSIKQGAKADLFASADTTNMKTVTSASLSTGRPKIFAKNKLEILVDKGNPMKITSADLAKPAVKVAVCAPSVPCGKYSTEIFDKANVTVKPVAEETSVSGVVTKVTLGEADAGIVYVTEVKSAAGKATGVPIPPNQNVVADYPIVQLKDAPNSPAARSFMQYVDSSSGQKVIDSYGFLPPAS